MMLFTQLDRNHVDGTPVIHVPGLGFIQSVSRLNTSYRVSSFVDHNDYDEHVVNGVYRACSGTNSGE